MPTYQLAADVDPSRTWPQLCPSPASQPDETIVPTVRTVPAFLG